MLDESWEGRRVLLLQGPVGPFFKHLAAALTAAGAVQVLKVNFNGGDRFFFPGGIDFQQPSSAFETFAEALLVQHALDAVALFGDCRDMHHTMAKLCQQLNVRLYVFEEGYIRPAYITCEQRGVNGYSRLPKDIRFYQAQDLTAPEPAWEPPAWSYWAMVFWTVVYYLACWLQIRRFPVYRHHRSLSPLEGLRWGRGTWRKWFHRFRERGLQQRLTTSLSGRYFLVPLQVHNDSQIHFHSHYGDVREFMHEVASSFARHGPSDHFLVFKHHPMDRAYRDYRCELKALMTRLGLEGRLLYLHDQHLPSLLSHAAGVVVINSTVGLAAVACGVAVKAMGLAFYDMPTIAHQGSLRSFWSARLRQRPRAESYLALRRWLVCRVLYNDSFYMAAPHSRFWRVEAPSGCTISPAQATRPPTTQLPSKPTRTS